MNFLFFFIYLMRYFFHLFFRKIQINQICSGKMKIINFYFRICFFVILFFVTSNAFDCSGLRDENCDDFTYAGTFYASKNERIAALNKFYQSYYYENSTHNKNYTFELDENEVFYYNFCHL